MIIPNRKKGWYGCYSESGRRISHMNYLISKKTVSLEAKNKFTKKESLAISAIESSENKNQELYKKNVDDIYDIFATYYNGRSRGLVVKAFLRLSAYNYLIKDTVVPSNILESLYLEIEKGNIDDEISKMALLLYFSHLDRFTERQKNWIAGTVSRFIDAGKILPFYKSFASFIRLPQDVFLKTYECLLYSYYILYVQSRHKQQYLPLSK